VSPATPTVQGSVYGLTSSGATNTALGYNSINTTLTGTDNVAIGSGALTAVTAGKENIAIGTTALRLATSANQNIAIGYQSLYSDTTGVNNIALGSRSLCLNQIGIKNVAIGNCSLMQATGNNNIAIGDNAGSGITTGANNTIIGAYTGAAALNGTVIITAGTTERLKIDNNGLSINGAAFTINAASPTSLGTVYGYTTGNGNSSYGCCAGNITQSGINNIAIGCYSLQANTTGNNNVSLGTGALCASSTGNCNISVGSSALCASTGSGNIAIGHSAGSAITTGVCNTIIGVLPGTAALSGTVLIGAGSTERLKVDSTGLYVNGNAYVGTSISAVDGTSKYYLGLSKPTTGAFTTASIDVSNLYYTSNNQTLYATNISFASDERLKENIKTIENSLDVLKSMRGVSFDWKLNKERSYGVIAQEIEKILPEIVGNDDGHRSVNYVSLIGFLIESVKELATRSDILVAEINDLKRKLP
jgi:hypothetical protein